MGQFAAHKTLCVPLLCLAGPLPSSLHCRLCLLATGGGGVHQEGPGTSSRGSVTKKRQKDKQRRCGSGAHFVGTVRVRE